MRERRRGSISWFALAIMVVFAFLMVGLIYQQQSVAQLLRYEQGYVDRIFLAQEIQTRAQLGALAQELGDDSLKQRLTPVSWTQNFSMKLAQTSGSVAWDADSRHLDRPRLYADGDKLFTSGVDPKDPAGDAYSRLPRVGYQAELAQKTRSGALLAPGSTHMQARFDAGPDHVTRFSHYWPYAVYAPRGHIDVVGNISSWSNPELAQSPADPADEQRIPLPARLKARRWIRVRGDFPFGEALSQMGPVCVPPGALAKTSDVPPGAAAEDQAMRRLSDTLHDAIQRLSEDALNKTKWVSGELGIDFFRALFSGKGNSVAALLSVEQACHFPFFPVPQVSEDFLMTTITIYHPYPADFSSFTDPETKQLSQEIQDLSKQSRQLQDQITAKQAEDDQLKKQIGDLEQQLLQEKDKDRQAQLRQQISDLSDQEDKVHHELSRLQSDFKEVKRKLKSLRKRMQEHYDKSQGTMGTVPETAAEDRGQREGSGLAVINFVGKLLDAAGRFISGHFREAMAQIVVPVRLVHLGAMDPEFEFGDKSSTYKATWTVPQGKTLRLTGRYGATDQTTVIAGDLWIQKGATCVVEGNLTLIHPEDWEYSDAAGSDQKVDYASQPAFPWGRVILEEGASLVVKGDLQVLGGSPILGSVMVASKPGSVRAVQQAILVQGDCTFRYGVHSGMTLIDSLIYSAEGGAQKFVSDFLRPLVTDVGPNLAKIIGPWDKRDPCYFARWSTNFVFLTFLDEIGVGFIPIPLPLFQSNCERDIFGYASTFFSYALNLNTGENLYPNSFWWPFGRGVVPVVLKISPHLLNAEFRDIDYPKLLLNDFEGLFTDFIKGLIVQIGPSILNDVIVKIVQSMLMERGWFEASPCFDADEIDKLMKDVEKPIKDRITKLLQTKLKNTLTQELIKIVFTVGKSIEDAGLKAGSARFLCREVPGCLVYAQKSLTIGDGGENYDQTTLMSAGFFFAEGDCTVTSQRIVGACCSRSGNIQIRGELLHYPFFSAASLFVSERGYLKSDGADLANAFKFVNHQGTALDIDIPYYQVLSEGWTR